MLLFALSACSEKHTPVSTSLWTGEVSITLPKGFSVSQDEYGNQIYSDGIQTIGGMIIRSIPEGFERTDYFGKDFLIALGIEEASDNSLAHSGGGSLPGAGNGEWSIEYFSNVYDSKDRDVHMVHQLFVMNNGITILDFWFDLTCVDNAVKDQIVNSIEIPEINRYQSDPPTSQPDTAQELAYELLELPDGFVYDNLSERCILIINGVNVVAGLDIVKIPDSFYDSKDSNWNWLKKAHLSDFRSEDLQYLDGMTAYDGSWIAEFKNNIPEGQIGYIHRRHIYRVIENDLYDFWLEMGLLTFEQAETLSKAVQFLES